MFNKSVLFTYSSVKNKRLLLLEIEEETDILTFLEQEFTMLREICLESCIDLMFFKPGVGGHIIDYEIITAVKSGKIQNFYANVDKYIK
jgi:hypothetical protein